MKVLLIGAVACAGLFVLALIYPPASRKAQAVLRRFSKKGEAKSDSSGGVVGDWTRDGLKKVRKASDKSARTGRTAHRKVRDVFR